MGYVVNATPRPHYAREDPIPMNERQDYPHRRSGRMLKNWLSPGFDPRTVQPVTSRYTDWATPARGYEEVVFQKGGRKREAGT